MAKTNTARKAPPIYTHEGGRAARITPEQALRRSVMSCLLWEDEFYEDGMQIAQRIAELAAACKPEVVAALAIEARRVYGLRHAPLLLLLDLIRRGGTGVAEAIDGTIRRADEMAELLNLYWLANPNKGLSKQLKKGLAKAFGRFDEYQLAKYDREGAVRLRDVLFQSHAKPTTPEQEALFSRVATRSLLTPDTWEVALSGGADKAETFTRLIKEDKLGYMALLRNLRNMAEAGVSTALVEGAILARRGAELVFPYRFLSASKAAPMFDRALDQALLAKIDTLPAFDGLTVVAIDTSGSMEGKMSNKSEVLRVEAAASLGAMVNGNVRMIIFGDWAKGIAARRGLAGVDTVRAEIGSVGHGTNMAAAVDLANTMKADRLILISDEQSYSTLPAFNGKHAYVINVASTQYGVAYEGKWTKLSGFSEATLRYIGEIEKSAAA
jgi:hypothetical protein